MSKYIEFKDVKKDISNGRGRDRSLKWSELFHR